MVAPPASILQCQDPTPPAMECNVTRLYGVPRGQPGRGPASIAGIAVHGINSTFDAYIQQACVGTLKALDNCHATMHYVIDAQTGAVSSLVPEADIAWAFQSYRTNFPITYPIDGCPCPPPCPAPPCPGPPTEQIEYPGWPVLSAQFPNLSADFFTINIGITRPNRPEDTVLDNMNCCTTPYGISERAYDTLVRLVAWIQSRYPAIILDDEHIAFHDEIVVRELECLEFPCGPTGVCFICDISRYCEKCTNAGDPTLSYISNLDGLRFVYGETTGGCRVKVLLTDLIAYIQAAE